MASTPFSTPPRPQTASSSDPSSSTLRPQSSTTIGAGQSSHNASPGTPDTSIAFLDSPSSWRPRKRNLQASTFHRSALLVKRPVRWIVLSLCLILVFCICQTIPPQTELDVLTDDMLIDDNEMRGISEDRIYHKKHHLSPQEWIRRNSHGHEEPPLGQKHPLLQTRRPRAALISLVRSSELSGILQSMRQLEYHFNRHYNYPWIFFSEKPFTADFINQTSHITNARTQYELIPREHWSVPDWVDLDRFMQSLDYLGALGVGKGHMVSYRHMCRWNSGFFYKHPALTDYDYYWRVEPDVHFFCNIRYDPFRLFEEFGFVYGFNMAILEDARSFPSLWPATRKFVGEHPELVSKGADVSWLMDGSSGGGYNNCQFFSNFEIGDLRFFRGNSTWRNGANEKYFNYLDKMGGFFYERFGDAPIHTLSVSLFAPRNKVWFFGDVGYQHDIARFCPKESAGSCMCEGTRVDENFYKLVPMESPQRKPRDTCLRMWLESARKGEEGDGGSGWLAKKEGWDAEVERAFGGDGYGGYSREG